MGKSARLDPSILLSAYAQGAFPMADHDGVVRWYTADPRGIIPLDDAFHISRSLQRLLRQSKFQVRINSDFEATMRGCMERRPEGTWINQQIIDAYLLLHRMGLAHSIEVWQAGELAGGLYGVSLGAAFFGESMFHRKTNASKVALAATVQRLRQRGYELFDTQACTPHLSTFGCIEIPASAYLRRLSQALSRQCEFA